MWYVDSSWDRFSTFRNTEETADKDQNLQDDITVIPKALRFREPERVSRVTILFIAHQDRDKSNQSTRKHDKTGPPT